MVLGFALWNIAERPGLLISSSAGLIGLMSENGRVLNKPNGEGFAASNWLENDGDAVVQDAAFARPGLSGEKGRLSFSFGGQSVVHLSGRGAVGRVDAMCRSADVVILSGALPEGTKPIPGCMVIDRNFLRNTGSLAVYATPNGWQIIDTVTAGGRRIWNAGRN